MEHKQITFEKFIEMHERLLPAFFENFIVEEKKNFCDMIGIPTMDEYVIQINDIFIYFDDYSIESCDEYDDIDLYAGNTRIANLTVEDLMYIDNFKEYIKKQFELWKKKYEVAEEA